MQSIIENASAEHEYHIIIFDCGINPADIAVLERQIEQYDNFRLAVENITAYMEKYKKAFYVRKTQSISPAAYGRLLVPELCLDHEKVIYADIDMIFNRDPAELISLDLGKNYIAAVADIAVPNWLKKRIPLGQYINSGLLVFSAPAWRQNSLTEKAIKLLMKRRLKKHDQDAVNILCKDRVAYLDKSWNCINVSAAPDKAVLHFVGAIKPWYSFSVPKAEIWWDYARSVETYRDLFDAAKINKARLNMRKEKIIYRFLGIPFMRVKISARSKKYYPFALSDFHFAEIRNDIVKQRMSYYFCHIKFFSKKACWD